MTKRIKNDAVIDPIDRIESGSAGVVFEIQRWALHDGPGIRTVLFFKGCPLRCAWCCNPEAWNPKPQLALFADKCRGCGQCVEVCSQGAALPANEDGFKKVSDCTACGRCVEVCLDGARELMGKVMQANEAMDIIERDRIFYRRSGGGVTFSGGEPLRQADFLKKTVERCRETGIPMALETCGYFTWAENKEILGQMDLVFLDIKHMDPVIHQRLTGVDNRIILDNAVHIARQGIPLVIRIPLIPSLNDDHENIEATAAFVSERLNGALGIEVLPYHTLGIGKYNALGLEYRLGQIALPKSENVDKVKAIIAEFNIKILSF